MKRHKLVLAFLSLGLLQMPLILAGCQAQQMGNKPGDELNPSMPAHQKQMRMKQSGGNGP